MDNKEIVEAIQEMMNNWIATEKKVTSTCPNASKEEVYAVVSRLMTESLYGR